MFTRHLTFSILTLSLLALANACSEAPPQRERARTARRQHQPVGIEKSEWLEALPSAMSEELCDQSSALLQCYPVSTDQCRQQVKDVTASCEDRYQNQIPSRLLEKDAEELGAEIGECAKNGVVQVFDASNQLAVNGQCRQDVLDM